MKVLIACEYSGAVRDAFIAKGHDAMSCDLLPTDVEGPHYTGDVFDIIDQDWDLMIAHPPCTFLTNAGVRWLYNADKSLNEERWTNMREGSEFFKKLLEADIPKIAIENPVMHKYAKEIIGRGQDQIVQPWQHGHTESKGTGLWLKGLPLLTETDNVKEAMQALPKKESHKVHYASPGPDRWKLRSTTYSGIASAMADQWG